MNCHIEIFRIFQNLAGLRKLLPRWYSKRFAFLFGDAGLGCADEVLFGSLKPYDREEAERDREVSLSAVDKAVPDAVAEPFGYLGADQKETSWRV